MNFINKIIILIGINNIGLICNASVRNNVRPICCYISKVVNFGSENASYKMNNSEFYEFEMSKFTEPTGYVMSKSTRQIHDNSTLIIKKGSYIMNVSQNNIKYTVQKEKTQPILPGLYLINFEEDQKITKINKNKLDNNVEKNIRKIVYSVNIGKDRDIWYYMNLLSTLMKNNKQLNNGVINGRYNDITMLQNLNYMMPNDAKELFARLFFNVIKEMNNSKLIKQYNIKNIIKQLHCNFLNYNLDNNELDRIWMQFDRAIKHKLLPRNNLKTAIFIAIVLIASHYLYSYYK